MWDKRTRTLDSSSISRIQAGCPGCGRAYPTARSRVEAVGSRGCEPFAGPAAGSESPAGHCRPDTECWWQAAKTCTRVRPRNIKRLLSIRSFPKRLCNKFRPHLTDFSLLLLQCLPTGGCPESLLQPAGHEEGLLNPSFPLSHAGSRGIQNCISDPQAARLFSITPMRTSLHKQPLIF